MTRNALQAVLDRANQATPSVAAPEPTPRAAPARTERVRKPTAEPAAKAKEQPAFHRASREGKQLIAGHFPKSVAKQLKLLSVEEDTSVQELLGEALDLLFVKKGRARIADITKRSE